MQLEKRFDVREHLRNQLLLKHVVRAVLLIDPKLKDLQNNNK